MSSPSALFTAALLLFTTRESNAVDGDLDFSFGAGGLVRHQVSGFEVIGDIVVQPDGKILAVGESDFQIALVRYLPDGSPDTTFGNAGVVIPNGPGVIRNDGYGHSLQLALQSDNKIVVTGTITPTVSPAGVPSPNVMVMRFNVNGSPDTLFGDGGTVSVPFGKDSYGTDIPVSVNDLEIQPDGKILVGGNGFQTESSFALLRFNPDGSLDGGFGVGGKVSLNPTMLSVPGTFIGTGLYTLALQADGKIIAAGGTRFALTDSVRGEFLVIRFNADGSLDPSFDGEGLAFTAFYPPSAGLSALALDSVVQADGKIVLGGYTFVPAIGSEISMKKAAMARFNTDGSIDSTFGIGGKLTADPGGFSEFRSVKILPGGKLAAVGSKNILSGSEDMIVARFHSNGSLEAEFGNAGIMSIDYYGRRDHALSTGVQPDGKLIVAGMATTPNEGRNFALARFTLNGLLDPSFGTGGKMERIVSSRTILLKKAGIYPDGKIIAAGATGGVVLFARYFPNGTLDPGFGVNGSVTQEFDNLLRMTSGTGLIEPPDFPLEVRSLHIQSDGRIVAAGGGGLFGILTPRHFLFTRLLVNGSPDTTFNQDGKLMVLENPGGFTDVREGLYDAIVQPDGKIVMSGIIRYGGLDHTLTNLIRRYNADGTRDTAFSYSQDEDVMAYRSAFQYLAFQADGKVVGVGDGLVSRLNHNGRPDLCFGTGGFVEVSDAQLMNGHAIAIQSDGRIVIGGYNLRDVNGITEQDPMVARFLPDGAFDTTFGNGGRMFVETTGSSFLNSLALSTDGKILAGGAMHKPSAADTYDSLLLRVDANGILDTTFGSGGILVQNKGVGLDDQIETLALQGDGRIISGGPGIVRYLSASLPVTLPVLPAPPTSDLAITAADAPDPVEAGTLLTCTTTIRNKGATNATTVKLDETLTQLDAGGRVLPATFIIESATAPQGTCTIFGTRVVCSLANLAPGASTTVTVKVRPRDAGGIRNGIRGDTCDQVDLNYTDNLVTLYTTVQPPQPPAVTFLPTVSGRPVLSLIEGHSGVAPLAFPVRLTAPVTQPVTVNYSIGCETACHPADFANTTGTLTFAPGETVKTIIVPVHGDTEAEGSSTRSYEFFAMLLSAPVNATLGTYPNARGQIYDDDSARFLIVAKAPFTVAKGAELSYTIHYSTATVAQTNVVITNPIPIGAEFISASDGGTLVNGSVVFNAGNIAANSGVHTVSFKVRVTADAGSIITNAGYTLTATGGAAATGDEISTLVTAGASATGPPFVITGIVRNPATKALTITWNSEAGRIYNVEYSTGLTGWTEIAAGLTGQAGSSTFLDNAAARTGGGEGFYRVTTPGS
jgi:uncharacterized delta-60 repeat protein